MLKDLRHGLRTLLHTKAWTAVVVISLALGIGANTALFSAVNGVLLKKIDVRDPDSLVRLRWAGRNDMSTNQSDYGFSGVDATGQNIRATFSFPMFQQFLADNQTMEEMLASAPYNRVNLVVDGQAELATAFIATGNYFRMLGVQASLGRTFGPDDDEPTAAPVAVISHALWRSRLGADPTVIGKSVNINNVPVTIVGVLPVGFTGIQQAAGEAPEVTVPLVLDSQLNTAESQRLKQPTNWWLQVVGRVKPGITATHVQSNLENVFRNTARSGLDSYLAGLSAEARSTARNRSRKEIPQLRVDSGRHGVYNANTTDTRALAILSGVVILVLLIVCANVANLLLSRATARQKEVSVRLSLGATRARLIRQLLTESLLLAAAGGAMGLVLGHWGRTLLPGAPGRATPMDWRVIAFVVGVTCLTAIVFGIAPAIRATGINVNAALKESSRSVAGSRTWLTKALLIAQVSISLVLLIGAGLFLRTVQNLRSVDVGFNANNLVLFRVSPQLNRYDEKRSRLLYQEMLSRLGSVGGVRSAGLSQPALLSGSVNSTSLFIQGRSYTVEQRDSINRLVVSPEFFQTMQIPLLVGRGFTTADTEGSPLVVVINDAAARKYFPNQNPIGQRVGSSVENANQLEIVGVLRDAKYNSVRDEVPATMYVPFLQAGAANPSFAVRTAGDPTSAVGAIREAMRQIDPALPITDVSTQMEQVERRLEQEKLFARAYALFGGIALVLASVGLFGLMSYSVARRTNEIGIRMALGAQRVDVLRQVLKESMTLVVVGVIVGLAIAFGAGRLVSSQLFGIEPTDTTTLVLAILTMVVVAAVAGYLPARRAAGVDPMVALRSE